MLRGVGVGVQNWLLKALFSQFSCRCAQRWVSDTLEHGHQKFSNPTSSHRQDSTSRDSVIWNKQTHDIHHWVADYEVHAHIHTCMHACIHTYIHTGAHACILLQEQQDTYNQHGGIETHVHAQSRSAQPNFVVDSRTGDAQQGWVSRCDSSRQCKSAKRVERDGFPISCLIFLCACLFSRLLAHLRSNAR